MFDDSGLTKIIICSRCRNRIGMYIVNSDIFDGSVCGEFNVNIISDEYIACSHFDPDFDIDSITSDMWLCGIII